MDSINSAILLIDSYFGSSPWFPALLLGTGIFFTIYLKFPQIIFFNRAWKILFSGNKYEDNKGETTPFQALSTALSGTVGTGNIGGVAMAIFIGGPAALFWMWITAFLGMTTKYVEVSLAHKYRISLGDGSIAGGPMYYMQNGLKSKWLGIIFAFCLLVTTFGSGMMPQIDNISSTLFSSFSIPNLTTSIVMTFLVGLVIIGGLKRIASVAASIVPTMAIIYFIGALSVIFYNYENILPTFQMIFSDIFTGTSVVGGFLGASIATAFNYGVARGLYSNEAGQGSAPIAHATSKTTESIEEGFVSILEPFIDTIVICTLTGLVILSSGAWIEKYENKFERTTFFILEGSFDETDSEELIDFFQGNNNSINLHSGEISIKSGRIEGNYTFINNRSFAEDIIIYENENLFNGEIIVNDGLVSSDVDIVGKSLVKSAVLTSKAFNKGFFGDYGEYIVTLGLLLFAFSTVVSWSYYGDRCTIYLFGKKYVFLYRIVYMSAFFIVGTGWIDTEIIWNFALITVAAAALPNLIAIFLLSKEMRTLQDNYTQYK